MAVGQSADSYGNFPVFDGSDARAGGSSYLRYNFPNGWFVGGGGGRAGLGMNGFNRDDAFGDTRSLYSQGLLSQGLYSQGVQFGYNFQTAGGLPLTVYAGFDTLKYSPGIGSPFAPFDTMSSARPGYSAHAGIEFQPTSNVSLALGFGYTQQPDINSLALSGASPFAFSGRR
jgi:opacity protein-like surface antigen